MAEFSAMTEQQRRNFRVPVQMDSFVYPADKSWSGRRKIQTIDVSCGGIAFYADPGLKPGDIVEVVLPMTVNPLIVQVELLRKEQTEGEYARYAAKFIALGPEADQMIGEAVFQIQRQNRLWTRNEEETEV